MRADVYLVTNGFCESRNKASQSIEAGLLYVNEKNVSKCSYDIADSDKVELRGEACTYVGRGGIKLAGALKAFEIDVTDAVCVDIGASTGGFTDCLLQNGAKKVFAVENGSSQLHHSLVNDSRVVNMENFNAKLLTPESLGQKCDVAVMDVSFISQTHLHCAVANVLRDGGLFISLIKPQFEVGKSFIGRGGIVKDKNAHASAIEKTVTSAAGFGLSLSAIIPSPIYGGDGNKEFIALFDHSQPPKMILTKETIKKLINT